MYMQYHMQGYNDNDLHDLFLYTVRTFHPEVTHHHRTKLVTQLMKFVRDTHELLNDLNFYQNQTLNPEVLKELQDIYYDTKLYQSTTQNPYKAYLKQFLTAITSLHKQKYPHATTTPRKVFIQSKSRYVY